MTFITTQADRTYLISSSEKKRGGHLSHFIHWASAQEAEYHIAWVGASIMSMAGVFFPLTMTAVLLNGAAFSLIIGAMAALSLVVVTNLAAMPTRYTIPIFILSVFASLMISIASFFVN